MTDQEILSIKNKFGIIGTSQVLSHAIQVAAQVAATDMTVLITGESGSGKESFSKIIHQLSHRKHGQFIAINCGAIPEGTIDSELFGHEKGSFTGAHEGRKGYFEVTDGGSIFLDEIGEMPMGTQARLLRVLENGEFIRVGSSKVQKTDVRVIAATNVKLLDAVEKGKFREDLYYRLNTVPIYVPPLRERGNDIDLLFRKFAGDFADKYKMKPIRLAEDAKTLLLKFRFPGNIRQLKNLADQISVLETEREISASVLSKYIPQEQTNLLPSLSKSFGNQDSGMSERDILYKVLFDMRKDVTELKKLVFELIANGKIDDTVLKENRDLFRGFENEEPRQASLPQSTTNAPILISPNSNETNTFNLDIIQDISHEDEEESLSLETREKELILKALKKNKNKRRHAAKDLGISERTLYRKLKEYGLEE
ncbi:MAG: sigma-54-dependent Fis family transcriptional regulator [Opitutaceae bacterium]|nr:sigma-54-dependent Fis family transcriptional regulator [Cytophagales bacterium]